MVASQRLESFRETDEIAGNEPCSLMNHLIEGMLAVRARLTPIDRSGLVTDGLAVESHMLSVAFHGELLEVSRKAFEILLVGKHRDRFRAEEVVIPDGQ